MAPTSILFVADPWRTLEHATESTLILAREAQNQGLRCYWATPEQIYFRKDRLYATGAALLTAAAQGLEPLGEDLDLTRVHSLHWRCDPPVTLATMRFWSLMDSLSHRHRLVNSARALLTWNEKYACLRYPRWTPETFVSNDRALRQKEEQRLTAGGRAFVVKPAGEAASRGVVAHGHLNADRRQQQRRASDQEPDGSPNLGPWALLQAFEPAVFRGETRVFLMGGRIAGCLRKTPRTDDPVMRWHSEEVKPIVELTTPSATQKTRALAVAKDLKREGVIFATVDFIGGKLLEINLTSPGLLHALGPEGERAASKAYWRAIL